MTCHGREERQTRRTRNESAERLVDALGSLGDVTSRKMVGGYGVFCDGVMFALVDSTGLAHLRTDESTAVRFEEKGSGSIPAGVLVRRFEKPGGHMFFLPLEGKVAPAPRRGRMGGDTGPTKHTSQQRFGASPTPTSLRSPTPPSRAGNKTYPHSELRSLRGVSQLSRNKTPQGKENGPHGAGLGHGACKSRQMSQGTDEPYRKGVQLCCGPGLLRRGDCGPRRSGFLPGPGRLLRNLCGCSSASPEPSSIK
jgi:hypothetical protein